MQYDLTRQVTQRLTGVCTMNYILAGKIDEVTERRWDLVKQCNVTLDSLHE